MPVRRAVPLLSLITVTVALGGCPAPVEGFDTEIRFVTPANQDVFAELERLEITFYYSGEEPIGFVVDAPFEAEQPLDDLPRAEAGEVRVEVLGWVSDSTSTDGWRLATQGDANGFSLPSDDPITIFLALKGQISLLPGGLSVPRSDGIPILLDDGRILIVGGLDANGPVGPIETLLDDTQHIFEGTNGTTHQELPRVAHNAFMVADSGTDFDGKIVVAGGAESCTKFYCFPVLDPSTESCIIDPGTLEISVFSQNSVIMVGALPAKLTGGRHGFLGGFNIDTYLNSISVFDPVTETVSNTTSSIESREQHTVTALSEVGSSVLVTGGFVMAQNQPTLLTHAEIWSGSGEGVPTTGELNEARFRHTATLLLDGSILIAGGATGDSWDDPGTALSSVELYNPATQEFTLQSSSLNFARQRHVAVRVEDEPGSVLVCGGVATAAGGEPVPACELYDPVAGTFSLVEGPALAPGGEGMMAVTLDSGYILLFGGMASGKARGEIYFYIP